MNRTLISMLGAAWVVGTLACGGGDSGPGGTGGAGGSVSAGGSGGGAARGGASGSGGATGTGGTTGAGGSTDAATPGSGGSTGSGGSGGGSDAGGSDAGGNTDMGGGRNDAGGDAASSGDAAGGAANAKMSFFITSETSATGNLGGIAMADAKCQRLAAAAGVGGKMWKAYLSTATENARERIGTGPWFNFKGEMIAANLVQLHEEGGMKNNLTQATGLTDTGKIVPGRMRNPGENNEHDVLTGSLRSGMVKPDAHCNNWTATTGSSGVGHADRMGIQADPVVAASWNDAHEGQCSNTTPGGGAGRFYCFATN